MSAFRSKPRENDIDKLAELLQATRMGVDGLRNDLEARLTSVEEAAATAAKAAAVAALESVVTGAAKEKATSPAAVSPAAVSPPAVSPELLSNSSLTFSSVADAPVVRPLAADLDSVAEMEPAAHASHHTKASSGQRVSFSDVVVEHEVSAPSSLDTSLMNSPGSAREEEEEEELLTCDVAESPTPQRNLPSCRLLVQVPMVSKAGIIGQSKGELTLKPEADECHQSSGQAASAETECHRPSDDCRKASSDDEVGRRSAQIASSPVWSDSGSDENMAQEAEAEALHARLKSSVAKGLCHLRNLEEITSKRQGGAIVQSTIV